MQPESLVQLIGSGNSSVVEKEWMDVVESDEMAPSTLVRYRPVLEALCKEGKRDVAAEYAWAALESLSGRHAPQVVLTVAGPFLLAVGNNEELRAQVAELYRKAYTDVDGLEGLLKEAGIEVGRPVRRAVRTLEVCLGSKEGDYLVLRDEDGAARIDAIDRSEWRFTINVGDGVETLSAVQLADAYAPASPTDFQVLRRFAPDQFLESLQADPGSMVVELCKRNGSSINSIQLEELLVPHPFTEAQWKKWWTRARTALRKNPNILLEGRSPYSISFLDVPIQLEDELWTEIQKVRVPIRQLEIVDDYLRECKVRNASPSNEVLCRCHAFLSERAAQSVKSQSADSVVRSAIAARVGMLGKASNPAGELVSLLKSADDFTVLFEKLESEALVDVACACLTEARPEDWQDVLMELLPSLPRACCDRAASQLIQAGRPMEDFHPVIARILSTPVAYFGALLWLWDGPEGLELPPNAQPVSLLLRIVRALEEARLSESVPKAKLMNMKTGARSTLSARKYERFEDCLAGLDAGMASAVRSQLQRSDTLGRAVREDLLKRLSSLFPHSKEEETTPPWDRDDVLFVTRQGLQRKNDEITEHLNVKMKENSRAIGRAAERGDLSENSEYKFALEERDLLRARLAQMNAEVAQSRIIDPAEVPMHHIGIGTTAVFKRVGDGARYEMSFLGPWEADAEKQVFNYRAPLARSLMGKCVGDVVDFDHAGTQGTYEIIELRNALVAHEDS